MKKNKIKASTLKRVLRAVGKRKALLALTLLCALIYVIASVIIPVFVGDAVDLAIDAGKISTSLLQRRLEVGYGRAAKIIDRMEEMGFVSAPDGNKPRKILITREEFEERRMNSGDSE